MLHFVNRATKPYHSWPKSSLVVNRVVTVTIQNTQFTLIQDGSTQSRNGKTFVDVSFIIRIDLSSHLGMVHGGGKFVGLNDL